MSIQEASDWELLSELRRRGWRLCYADTSGMPMAIVSRKHQAMIDSIFTESFVHGDIRFELRPSQINQLGQLIEPRFNPRGMYYTLKPKATEEQLRKALSQIQELEELLDEMEVDE